MGPDAVHARGDCALWYWGGPLAVTLLAAVLRLWNLGHPHSLVFDETFYVKDAYTLLRNGVESTWPDDADAQFNAGDTDIYNSDGSYVVHPPLGKWIIALGLAVFGAGDSFGWRIGTAVVGILAVAAHHRHRAQAVPRLHAPRRASPASCSRSTATRS